MKNAELVLSLIDLPEDKDVVILVSGWYHKITGVKKIGDNIILNVEGSIVCIEKDFSEYLEKKYQNTSINFIDKP